MQNSDDKMRERQLSKSCTEKCITDDANTEFESKSTAPPASSPCVLSAALIALWGMIYLDMRLECSRKSGGRDRKTKTTRFLTTAAKGQVFQLSRCNNPMLFMSMQWSPVALLTLKLRSIMGY